MPAGPSAVGVARPDPLRARPAGRASTRSDPRALSRGRGGRRDATIAAQYDRAEGRRSAGPPPRARARGEVSPAKGPDPVQTLVQGDAEGELVALRGDARSRELLRGHVRRRPEQRAGGGETRRRRALFLGRGGTAALVGARQPEVHHPHATVCTEHHVVRLEVAMDQPLGVRRTKAGAGGHEHAENVSPRTRLLRHPCREGVALHELHRHEHALLVDTDIVHGHDVGIVDAGERLRLALKACPRAGRVGGSRSQELQRHLAVELGIVRRHDYAHRARTESGQDDVAPDDRPGLGLPGHRARVIALGRGRRDRVLARPRDHRSANGTRA